MRAGRLSVRPERQNGGSMASRSHTTFKKRQKELARLDKQREKAARRVQRKLEKGRPDEGGATADEDVPDEGGATAVEDVLVSEQQQPNGAA